MSAYTSSSIVLFMHVPKNILEGGQQGDQDQNLGLDMY